MALSVKHQGQEAFFSQESHLAVSTGHRFAEIIFWLLAERRPKTAELQIFELILNLSIDHGPDTPSAQATIGAAKVGRSISQAVAVGIQEINDVHGGAQEQCMPLLYRLVEEKIVPAEMVKEYLAAKKRLPGFGHRLYTEIDPRAELILATLQKNDLGGDYISAARSLGQELQSQTGKKLPLNVDGAIAVALCAFGWPPTLGKAVFIVARTPGLCGQYLNAIGSA